MGIPQVELDKAGEAMIGELVEFLREHSEEPITVKEMQGVVRRIWGIRAGKTVWVGASEGANPGLVREMERLFDSGRAEKRLVRGQVYYGVPKGG